MILTELATVSKQLIQFDTIATVRMQMMKNLLGDLAPQKIMTIVRGN